MKLLIVDDEPIIVRGLTQLVDYAALGYDQVMTATKSSEALAFLRQEKPEAMLSDIAMPGLTGLELLRLIRDEGLPNKSFSSAATAALNMRRRPWHWAQRIICSSPSIRRS